MPKITFNGINIEIGFDKKSLSESHTQEFKQNSSSSGKIQTVNIFGREELSFSSMLTEDAESRLWAWWAWARQGKSWAFALSSDRMSATSVSAGVNSGQKIISVNSASLISVDDRIFLKAVDHDNEFEMIKVASKDNS